MQKQSDAHKDAVINYYDNTRPEYRLIWRNRHNLGLHFGYYDSSHTTHDTAVLNLNAKLAEYANIRESDIVLDAGYGVGGSGIWLAKNIGCSSIGIGIVPRQIRRAIRNADRRGISDKVSFMVSDFTDTSFEDASFSIFWSVESVVHAQSKQDVLNEAFRILKPGGRLVIAEYLLKPGSLTKHEKGLLQEWLGGWAMPGINTQEEYRRMLKKAGFGAVKIEDWTEPMLPSFARLMRIGKRFKAALPFFKAFKLVNHNQLANLSATEAQMKLLEAGCWKYEAILAVKS